MDQLRREVARARRRLVIEQFLRRASLCLIAGLMIAAIAVAVPRVIVIESLPARWDVMWAIGGAFGGLVAAAIWTALSRRTLFDAAMEIDSRFGLRERIATSLSLGPEEAESEVGQAMLRDAMRAIRRVDVSERFRVTLDRRSGWALVPAALVFVLVTFVDTRRATSSLDPSAVAGLNQERRATAESLRKKIAEQAKKAEAKDLERAENLFKKIEQGTREIAEKEDLDRKKAVVKLNDLAQQLERRRQQLGGRDGLKEQFRRMKNLAAGPAQKAAQAMKEGDWKKALEEIEKLAKQMGELDAKSREQLAKQLEQMKENLQAAVDAHQQAREALKNQIEQLKQQGDLAKAGELQQKLEEMQLQQEQMEKLAELANQMGQIQQGLQQGDVQMAADAMQQLAKQLDGLQQEMNELEMLDMAMDQLKLAKDAMACNECQGGGCATCQGGLAGMGKVGNQRGGRGDGIGRGRGMGDGGEGEIEHHLRDTRVRDRPKQGPAVFAGTVAGPNIKGDAVQSIQEEMTSLGSEPADPLTSERLPRSRREHAEQYFEVLREGRPSD